MAAESYYEQLYCEVRAQGQGKHLPSFYDFQKNNGRTQAFLLKRPAARLGIQIVLPKLGQPRQRDKTSEQVARVQKAPVKGRVSLRASGFSGAEPSADPFDGCIFQAMEIQCGGVSYNLVGNLSNNKLSQGALEQKNKMNIPGYQGEPGDREALTEYLAKAYNQYISKMLEIGLGGSTFSYNKFAYLYYDVSGKGIDFSQRFETMFGYLKQDKQNLAVSERLPENVHLKKERCDWLRKKTVVCDGGQKNYVYQRY